VPGRLCCAMLSGMPVPSTAYGLAVLLILVIPGTVYAAVRTTVAGRGPHDSEITTRILWAILASAVFVAVYLLAFGEDLLRTFTWAGIREHPQRAGAVGLLLGIVVPAAAAYFVHGKPDWKRGRLSRLPNLPWPKATTGYESTPTAWDWAAPRKGGIFVRVRLDEGKWVGGWFGDDSFISTYPERHDIYIELQYDVSVRGKFQDVVEGSAGLWVAVEPGYLVEWVEPPTDQSDDQ
jgi:hypothetical protein